MKVMIVWLRVFKSFYVFVFYFFFECSYSHKGCSSWQVCESGTEVEWDYPYPNFLDVLDQSLLTTVANSKLTFAPCEHGIPQSRHLLSRHLLFKQLDPSGDLLSLMLGWVQPKDNLFLWVQNTKSDPRPCGVGAKAASPDQNLGESINKDKWCCHRCSVKFCPYRELMLVTCDNVLKFFSLRVAHRENWQNN